MKFLVFIASFFACFAEQIQIGKHRLEVEIADTHPLRAKGLMGRVHLEEGHGMLFIHDQCEVLSFWMKNTLIPLSIAFFDEQKTCINILDMDPPTSDKLALYKSKLAAKYALEVPQGWFKKHGISEGAKFSFIKQQNQVE